VYVRVDIETVTAQKIAFLAGMLTLSFYLIVKRLTNYPISHVIPHGKIKKAEGY
jgi:hypothetical protein